MKKILKFPIKFKEIPTSWILENLPEDHVNYDYLEPFGYFSSVIINKENSQEETINDNRKEIANILRALRDEPKELINKLSKIKYSKKYFDKFIEQSNQEDYLLNVVRDISLRIMSRGGHKKIFLENNAQFWNLALKDLMAIKERLKNIYIINKCPLEVLKAYNNEKTLCYCNTIWEDEFSIDMHNKLATLLQHYKGKVVIAGVNNSMYKRLYKGWKKTSYNNDVCVWVNF